MVDLKDLYALRSFYCLAIVLTLPSAAKADDSRGRDETGSVVRKDSKRVHRRPCAAGGYF
jgi:hypothetical protein